MAANGVLVTRPSPDAVQTASLLVARGWAPVLAPLITIEPRPLRAVESCDAVLVTSGNALAALGPAWHHTPLLAVGDRTAARAAAAGFSDIHSADGDAAALLALARARCAPGATLLLPAGAGQGAALAAALRAAGFRVHRRVAYAAQPVAAFPPAGGTALAEGWLVAALFLSALTAETFVRLLPPALAPRLATVDAVAIGTPTATALSCLPWRSVRVSAKPVLEQVLALL